MLCFFLLKIDFCDLGWFRSKRDSMRRFIQATGTFLFRLYAIRMNKQTKKVVVKRGILILILGHERSLLLTRRKFEVH
jgi:hypothetical protein